MARPGPLAGHGPAGMKPVGIDHSTMTARRHIIIGKNSAVWRGLAHAEGIAAKFSTALSHGEVGAFPFSPGDEVWIFSYAPTDAGNTQLIEALAAAGVRNAVYVSSASVIATDVTDCYRYPRVKKRAELEAQKQLGASIVRLGLVYTQPHELPAGSNMATSIGRIADFMLQPALPPPGTIVNLFENTDRPFSGRVEQSLYSWYGSLQSAAGRWPCLLRPIDYILRGLGMKWYGYVYLSNRLWNTTILS